jgi:hypothetical protein
MTKTTVEELMAEAFAPGRDPRSQEYKTGVRAILAWRINGVPLEMPPPFALGSAQADAYFAGQDEGKAIWRALQESD